MDRRVIAIGLDAADPDMLGPCIDAGHLPNLKRHFQSSAFCRFENKARYQDMEADYGSTEGSWVMLQSGMTPQTTGYWETVHYDASNYGATNDPTGGGYDYQEFPPFFALGDDYRVVAFDLPVSAHSPNVNGLQILGWGGHFPFVHRGSDPEGLLEEITAKYGKNEVLYNDYGVFWNPKYVAWLEKHSIDCIRKRTNVCVDLLKREPWDLFLAAYGETHGAGHDLWFTHDPQHPVHAAWRGAGDPLLRVYQAVDEAVGVIAAHVPDDANFIVYSAHGMQANQTDLGNFFMLPELMYRFNFPGRIGFAAGDADSEPRPPYLRGKHWYWFGDIWRMRHSNGPLRRAIRSLLPGWLVWPPGKDLAFPYLLDWFGAACGWLPSMWYRPAWPRMRCFALPSFADGHLRINLAGRDANGMVKPEEYEAECDRVTEFLLGVTNARTGKPVVKRVIRVRQSPGDDDPKLPHADLVLLWEDEPMDVIDSPVVGRIGPVPYYRTGGHRNVGFMAATGPEIAPGVTLPPAQALDFAPTVLQMMGAPIPDRLEGSSLLQSMERISQDTV